MQVGLGPGHIVLDGNPAPSPPKGGRSPQFSVHLYCGQMAGWIKMPLGREVDHSPSDIVLDGDPAPPLPKGGGVHQFWPHICCGQIAGWIKMPLDREVGISPSDIVLDGDPAPLPQKEGPPIFSPCLLWPRRLDGSRCHLAWSATWHGGRSRPRPHCARCGPSSPSPAQPPIFGPYLLWPNGWMDQDATWYGSRPQPRLHCVRRGPSSPPRERGTAPLLFSAHVYCGHSRPPQLYC